jgi:hypothetical protein
LLPPLSIKLGILKQFVKALPKTVNNFKYHSEKFPHLSEAKLNGGVSVGHDIRKLMFDEDLNLTMNAVEREAWIAFRSVVTNFVGNNKDPDNVTIVTNTCMLEKFKVLGY